MKKNNKHSNAHTGGAHGKKPHRKAEEEGTNNGQAEASSVKTGGVPADGRDTTADAVADPCEVLDAFLAIDHEQIEAAREEHIKKTMEPEEPRADEEAFRKIPILARTLPQHLEKFHYNLLPESTASGNCNPIEYGVYQLSWIVEEIIYTLWLLASERNSLPEFFLHVKQIAGENISVKEENEGLDDIPAGKLHETYLQIREVLMPMIMRQYGANHDADLFENDRMLYDVMREAGRRFIPEWKRRWGDLVEDEEQMRCRLQINAAKERVLEVNYGLEGIELFMKHRDQVFSGINYTSKEVEEADRVAKAEQATGKKGCCANAIAGSNNSGHGGDGGIEPVELASESGDKVTPSEILDAFFAISPKQIARDLEELERMVKTDPDVKRLPLTLKKPRLTQSAMDWAAYHHRKMIEAQWFTKYISLKDLEVIWVSRPVEQIANLACAVARGNGRLAELCSALENIARSEGFCSAMELRRARVEPPPAFKILDREETRILIGIENTMFVEIARRYHLDSIADLFEKRRMEYSVMREVGRRIDPWLECIGVTPEQRGKWDSYEERRIRSLYGQKAVDLLHKRLAIAKRKIKSIIKLIRMQ